MQRYDYQREDGMLPAHDGTWVHISDHEQAVAQAREALASAQSALANCYDVLAYPGNGQSQQDNALAEVREALAALSPTDSGK